MATTATKTSNQIEVIATQIGQILDQITTNKRLLLAQRREAGQLLIKLRNEFSIMNRNGTYRGSHKGSFCAYIRSKNWNVATCYEYIRLVEGREPTKVKEAYWQGVNRKMKKASEPQKIILLKQAANHLIKLYDIKATVTVSPRW